MITRVITRPTFANKYGLDGARIDALIRWLSRDAEIVSISDLVSPIAVRDPDDERILMSALVGRADVLVSGDQDLLVLASDTRLGSLQIITPRAFLDMLAADGPALTGSRKG